MGRGFRERRVLLTGYLIAETILYILFLSIDISGKDFGDLSAGLKYCGILLCFLSTFFLYPENTKSSERYLLRGALFFTAFSDIFLLFLDSYLIVGLLTFCIVQFLYLFRLYLWRKQRGFGQRFGVLLIRNGALILAVLGSLWGLNISPEPLMIVVVIYFTGILLNTLDALWLCLKVRKRKEILFGVGMLLFFLCDVNVGLFNLSSFIATESPWLDSLYSFASVAMWLFYLPAQVGIVLSGYPDINNG